MTGAGPLVAVVLLLGALGVAVARPRGLPEASAAVPAAGVVVALGVVTPPAAWAETTTLLPVVAFLAAVLALAHLCDAVCVRVHPPGELGVGAAACLEPDQPAGVHRERAVLLAFCGSHDPALGHGRGDRVRGAAPVLRC